MCSSALAMRETASDSSKPAVGKSVEPQARNMPMARGAGGTERAVQCSPPQAEPEQHVLKLQVSMVLSES